jgi:SAM-dependent methyltransferase
MEDKMVDTARHDAWQAGQSYEQYMGRWSRQVAPLFVRWLDAPSGAEWLEVGCGTGALTANILSLADPKSIVALDPSPGFLQEARSSIEDQRVEFRLGDAQDLDMAQQSRDVVVSGLVLNFVPDRAKALSEMRRVARPDATIGFYVWDYPGGGVQFMRAFWSAATSLDPSAAALTEDRRFPFCTPEGLTALASEAALQSIQVTAIEVPTVFRDFADFWRPFTLGTGPAPGYCINLAADARERLRVTLLETLPRQADGSIQLKTRAWAVKARP